MLKKQFTLNEAFRKLNEYIEEETDTIEKSETPVNKTKASEYIELLNDIKNAEQELKELDSKFRKEKEYFYNWPNQRTLTVASEDEIKRVNELNDEINNLRNEIEEIESSYQHEQGYRRWYRTGEDDWDDDWESETVVDDEEKKKELEPKVDELRDKVSKLQSEMYDLGKKLINLYNKNIDDEKANSDYEVKKTNLSSKKDHKKELLNNIVEEEGFTELVDTIKESYPNSEVIDFKYDDKERPVITVEITKHFDDFEDEDFDDDGEFYKDSFIENETDNIIEDIYFDDNKFDFEVKDSYIDEEPTISRTFHKGNYWSPDEWDVEIDGDCNLTVEIEFIKL